MSQPTQPSEPEAGPDNWSDTMGLEVTEWTAERVVARLEPDSRHHQPYGILHGGVYCSIVEDVASRGAGMAARASGQRGVVGVSNSTDFLRSHSGGALLAVALPVHASRTQHIWQVVISRSSDGKPVARGQVRFQVLDRLPGERGRG
ncbi:MAG: PaaI family thioesterase [Myxococcota bacterium]